MKKHFAIILALLLACWGAQAKDFNLASPNGRLKATVKVAQTISYRLAYDGQAIMKPSQVSLKITDGTTWGVGSKLKGSKASQHKGSIQGLFYKKSIVSDNYRQLLLQFGGFNLVFRAYDEGLAYQFVSTTQREFNVEDEIAEFNFAKDFGTWTPYVYDHQSLKDMLHNSFENSYDTIRISQFDKTRLAFLPLIVKADNGVKLIIAESDVEEYPCMFLKNGNQPTGFKSLFAPYPKEVKQGGYHQLEQLVTKSENYIAKSKGLRTFPWRIIGVSANDADILNSDMVYRLASPSRLTDTSWIKPGKVAWEWWNHWGLYKVNFKAGINTQTYKYYIDFAAKQGIEYVILDEGWAVNRKADLFQIVPEIDLQDIVSYANGKGVGIILWAGYKAFDRDMEKACKYFSEMGVKGFKIDFMNRNDAECVDFHYRAAKTAAKYHLLCDFHGTFAPTGLNRTYPNVINFEGVRGQEQNKWATIKEYDQPLYDVVVPFARMFAGQMDYTQGAMINSTKKTYVPNNHRPMSQGTRCHQLAEYVVFFSPLNMLCDSPTHYEENPECTEFISRIPVVWDETLPLKSEIGEYVAVARRKGQEWYVGAITNWTPRDLTLDLNPLKVAGKTATVYQDGPNAETFAEDWAMKEVQIPADGKLQVHLASGGGVAIKI